MNNKYLHIAIQLALAALVTVAITTQLSIHIANGFNVVNFFSFFTNLSNIFAAIMLYIGAYLLIVNKKSRVYDFFRGASVVFMAVVGVVFSLLLTGVDLGTLLPWVNTTLHYVMPIAVVAYWFIAPSKEFVRLKTAVLWLVFPAIYLVYSLIRGVAINWYAYPFLNPAQDGGYGAIALYSLFIFILFVIFGLILRWGANARLKKSAR